MCAFWYSNMHKRMFVFFQIYQIAHYNAAKLLKGIVTDVHSFFSEQLNFMSYKTIKTVYCSWVIFGVYPHSNFVVTENILPTIYRNSLILCQV